MNECKVTCEAGRFNNRWRLVDLETGRTMTEGTVFWCLDKAKEIYDG